ncbi:hypothetical protein [Moraxella lacunata]|uniref:hypothetical protein n=1 Tax=Moraxella lacunata TaxID=477 RepID=UPI003EE129FD
MAWVLGAVVPVATLNTLFTPPNALFTLSKKLACAVVAVKAITVANKTVCFIFLNPL